MLRITIAFAVIFYAATAHADDKYVPIVIDLQTYQALVNYLGDVPAKYANPILNTLAQKADEAKKAEEAKQQKQQEKKE